MNLEERAAAVVKVFGIIDKGTATDSKQKEKMLEVSYAVVRDFAESERIRELDERHRKENERLFSQAKCESPIPAGYGLVSDAEGNAKAAEEVVTDEVKTEEPKKGKAKKAEKTASQLIEEDKKEEEAPF